MRRTFYMVQDLEAISKTGHEVRITYTDRLYRVAVHKNGKGLTWAKGPDLFTALDRVMRALDEKTEAKAI